MADIANAFNEQAAVAPGFQILERTAIVPSLTNRKRFDPALLAELAESIKSVGVAQPILVRPLPGSRLEETWADRRAGDPAPTHEIVAGERRWRACGLAGVKQIPAMVRELDDEQVLRLQLIENLQREDLHPLEEADGYRRILDLPNHASEPMAARIEDLASQIKKSTRYIYQTLQLLKLADFPRQVFLDGNLQRTVALEIATIGNEAQQIEACRRVAGLARQGTNVVEHPMSHRAAAEYIRNTFRLLLSKAAFPIKVEFAGVAACTGCEKMSANASDLFDDASKVPDTCMDPSCYGKKNAKHFEQLAQAAKAKGQRVVTGKEAKKLLPYEYRADALAHNCGYESLDEKRWDVTGKNSGKTVAQLLGDDAPAPVLIQRSDGQGFVKALPTKDVDRLLKERGLLVKPAAQSLKNPQADAERKAKKIKDQRWAVATALLKALGTIAPSEPQPLNLADQNGLRAHLMLPMVVQMHHALDHDDRKRLGKLLEVDEKTLPPHPERKVVENYLQGLDGDGINRFIVGALIAHELHYAAYSHPTTDRMDMLCELLHVDGKKIKADMEAAEKAADKAKKAPAAKKIAAKATKAPANAAFMQPLEISPALAAVVGEGPMLRTTIVEKVWAYIKANGLQDQKNKRMVNADEKLKAVFGKDQVSMFELAAQIGKHTGANAKKAQKAGTSTPEPAAEGPTFQPGDRVRFKEGLKGPTGHFRKVCGREGTVSRIAAGGVVLVRTGSKGEGQGVRASPNELELLPPSKAAGDKPAWPFPTGTPKKTTARAAGSKTATVDTTGELDLSVRVELSPQPAWPFPTASKTPGAPA